MFFIPDGPIISKREIDGFEPIIGNTSAKPGGQQLSTQLMVGPFLSHSEAQRGFERELKARHFNAAEDFAVRHVHNQGQPYFTALGTPYLVARETDEGPGHTPHGVVVTQEGLEEAVGRVLIIKAQEYNAVKTKRRRQRLFGLGMAGLSAVLFYGTFATGNTFSDALATTVSPVISGFMGGGLGFLALKALFDQVHFSALKSAKQGMVYDPEQMAAAKALIRGEL